MLGYSLLMRIAFTLALLVLSIDILSGAQAQSAKPLNVDPEQVHRVEILYYPEQILVRAALTPERLEELYKYKLEIKVVHQRAEWQQLRSLLAETSVTPSGQSYDHRTAVLLFDQNGRRMASLYFAQFGKDGTINGVSGSIKGGVYHWAKSLLRGVPE